MSDNSSQNPRGITPERLQRSAFWANKLQAIINRILQNDTGVLHLCADALQDQFMACVMVQAGAMDMTVMNDDGSNPFEDVNLEAPRPHVVAELPEWMKSMGIKEEIDRQAQSSDPMIKRAAEQAKTLYDDRGGIGSMHHIAREAENRNIARNLLKESHDRRSGGRPPIGGIKTEAPMNTGMNSGKVAPHYHIIIRDENNRVIEVLRPTEWQNATAMVAQVSQQKEHFRHRITLQPGRCQGDQCPQLEVVPAIEDVKGLDVIATPHWARVAAERITALPPLAGCSDPKNWITHAASTIAQEFVRMQSIIFYGPHRCDQCGLGLIARGNADGGNGHLRFDYPNGPIYPNTPWRLHQCHAFKVDPDGYFGTQPVTGDGQDYETPPINRASSLGPARPSQSYSSNASSQPDGHAAEDRN